jgi:hypothetical protein
VARSFVSADQADALVGAGWFQGNAEKVEVVDEPVKVASFEAQPNFCVYKQGLTVDGAMHFAQGVRGIQVVLGDLFCDSLELGDSVLIVTGTLTARRYIFCPPSEGVLVVGGVQPVDNGDDAYPESVRTKTVVWFNRAKEKFEIESENANFKRLYPRPDMLDEPLLQTDDAFDPDKALRMLRDGTFPT